MTSRNKCAIFSMLILKEKLEMCVLHQLKVIAMRISKRTVATGCLRPRKYPQPPGYLMPLTRFQLYFTEAVDAFIVSFPVILVKVQ